MGFSSLDTEVSTGSGGDFRVAVGGSAAASRVPRHRGEAMFAESLNPSQDDQRCVVVPLFLYACMTFYVVGPSVVVQRGGKEPNDDGDDQILLVTEELAVFLVGSRAFGRRC
jgi:hypothetical protein